MTRQNFTFAENEDGWDQETGAPGISLFANALQCWSVMQQRQVTVWDAANAFKAHPDRIIEAVEYHPWMFLTGDQFDPHKTIIEHEGE
jgi:hypothetical protein